MKLSIKVKIKKAFAPWGKISVVGGLFFNMLSNDQDLFFIYAKIRKIPNEFGNKAIY